MNLRAGLFLGAMLIVLLEVPFLPMVAQDEVCVELIESVEGAREVAGLFGTKGAVLACIPEAVLTGIAPESGDIAGIAFPGPAGRFSFLKTLGILILCSPSSMNPDSAGLASIRVRREAEVLLYDSRSGK